ncbi:hypothetical protein PAF17_13010 [Paracoccus sp. Z330]|uniref:Putative regulatory protein FmdB zinc ribbon domain-containing protein n=1 Tax=Paracoccus onchidii TaxID=3017813 RepID=A0ABT4ZGD4_9RHOB|nr:hypothetical protein [Paracoccus onchidii]MDB6178417.1 hypothetical protein [Paracoccus onchidii]
MPIYDFACHDHGIFSDWASYETSRDGLPCPDCGKISAVLPSIPQVSRLSSALRRAETRADATSAAPKVMKRRHLPSCGCNLCKKAAPPTSRRWMLGQC